MSHSTLAFATLQCVVAIAVGLPAGGTAKVLAKCAAGSVARTRDLLTAAARAGLVVKIWRGRDVVWVSLGAAQAARMARHTVQMPRWTLRVGRGVQRMERVSNKG